MYFSKKNALFYFLSSLLALIIRNRVPTSSPQAP
nr:MAG TPA: hypothetical protein [Caudoviricetes sp.]